MRKVISFLIFLVMMLTTLALSSVRSTGYKQHHPAQQHPQGQLNENR